MARSTSLRVISHACAHEPAAIRVGDDVLAAIPDLGADLVIDGACSERTHIDQRLRFEPKMPRCLIRVQPFCWRWEAGFRAKLRARLVRICHGVMSPFIGEAERSARLTSPARIESVELRPHFPDTHGVGHAKTGFAGL